jgi:(S)-2-hydroxyglutarate dehydrogenase
VQRRAVGEDRVDVTVVGAGVVGLASARALLEREPMLRLRVLERHDRVAAGQSGHNSGVIHSGIYYKPGSSKARLCREGRSMLIDACRQWGIEYRICGKLIVATDEAEKDRLVSLLARGNENGLQGLRLLDPPAMRAIEPEVGGVQALHVPEAGVVDYAEVCAALAEDLRRRGARILLAEPLLEVRADEGCLVVRTPSTVTRTRALLNCAGLWSDDVARRAGTGVDLRIVPFRGEYWKLRPERAHLVRHLIYPVPDPALPFLGVHFTRDVHGVVDAGPNAVLAFAREGYTRRDVDLVHLARMATFAGAWRLLGRQWRHAYAEMRRSLDPHRLVADLRRLVPAIRLEDLEPAPAGVRAQAVDAQGRLVDDFHFLQGPRSLHVLNAPSPAATASLAIGAYVAERFLEAALAD